MVGCLIVKDDKIIGEGYTDPYGGSHAEVIAIKKTIAKIEQEFEITNAIPKDLFILTDSQSALDAIENFKSESSKQIEDLLQICHSASHRYGINITLQWIPGHCGIYGNEKADALAKLGSNMP